MATLSAGSATSPGLVARSLSWLLALLGSFTIKAEGIARVAMESPYMVAPSSGSTIVVVIGPCGPTYRIPASTFPSGTKCQVPG
jgi:hypothetical protein